MKKILQFIVNIFARQPTRGPEEQYLAQAVDAQELKIRLDALERSRH